MTAADLKNSSTKEKVISKRARRKKGSNPSTTWQQQPRIKTMADRDKAYLRNAGFKKSSAPKGVIDPNKDFVNSPEYKFGRLLASPNSRTRHATILKLKEYLKARTDPIKDDGGLSTLDLMKLWKGMWHTLYLCDGVAVQEEVSKCLAELMWAVGGTAEEDEYAGRLYLEMVEENEGNGETVPAGESDEEVEDDEEVDDDDDIKIISMDSGDEEDVEEEEMDEDDEESGNPAHDEETKHCRGAHLSALYVRTYLRTLTREWSNMDKYRIDKFYTLTRLILREIYRYCASRHWNLGIIRLFNDAIFEEVLRTSMFGNGVRYHLLDICMEELARVNSESATGLALTEATFLDCMEPFFAMAQRCDQKLVHNRAMEKVLLRFLEDFSVVSDNFNPVEEGDEDGEAKRKLVMGQVHVGTVGQFIFELASDIETFDQYRPQLYDMHKTYMKRIKSVDRDVDMTEDDEDPNIEQDIEEEEGVEGIDVEQSHNDEEEEKHEEVKSKKSKKKTKKSKKKKDNKPTEEEETEINVNESSKNDGKKKKKKKKRKSVDSNSTALSEEEEQIITITKKDQKAAAKAVARAARVAKAKATESHDSDTGEENCKKVKFRSMNTSKSYKASMKDLKKVDTKIILEKTPEKGILLKKEKKRRRKGSN
uniref:Uncharacterized protein n=1 Tax=Chaetoceros debilis TaxID=122233 RepID=A0A6S8W4W6_9STRA